MSPTTTQLGRAALGAPALAVPGLAVPGLRGAEAAGLADVAKALKAGVVSLVPAALNPFTPNEVTEKKIAEVALGWARLELQMKSDPKIARALKAHHDHWVPFWTDWQNGKKNQDAVNDIVRDLNAARANAAGTLTQNDPGRVREVPTDEISKARGAAEWINQNAPSFASASAALERTFPGVAQWLHGEPDAATAMRMAFAPGWPSVQKDRVRAIRALADASGWTIDALRVGHKVPKLPDGTQVFGSDEKPVYPTPEHNYVASALARTWMLFPPPGRYPVQTVATTGGDAAQKVKTSSSEAFVVGNDTSWAAVLIPVAVFVARAAFAYAVIACIAENGGNVIDRQLQRGSKTEKMMELAKVAHAVSMQHAQREQAEGKAIPFDAGELAVVNAFVEAQKDVAGTDGKFPMPFSGALSKITTSAGNAAEELSKTPRALADALPFAAIGAVVLGGVMLMRR